MQQGSFRLIDKQGKMFNLTSSVESLYQELLYSIHKPCLSFVVSTKPFGLLVNHIVFMLRAMVLFVLLGAGTWAQAEIVVIGSKDVAPVDKRAVKLLYMKKVKSFPNGIDALPLDLPDENELKWRFYKTVVGKKPSQVNSYWSRALFTGVGEPPEVVQSLAEIKSRIKSGQGIIAYVDANDLEPSMNVVFRIKE